MQRLEGETHVTCGLDSWTDGSNKSVVACTVTCASDRSTHLLSASDLSGARHTADVMAGTCVSLVDCG